jgi:ATP-binding cassette subfamily C protein
VTPPVAPASASLRTTVARCLGLVEASRWRWASLVPLALLAAAAEATSAAALFGLIKIVENPAAARTLPVASTISSFLPSQDERAVVLSFTVLLVIFYLIKNVLHVVQAYTQSGLVTEETANLARRLLIAYLRAPYAFHLRRNSAELIRTVAYSSEVVFRNAMAPAVALAFESLVMVAIAGVLMVIAPAATIGITILLGTAAAVFVRATRAAVQRWGGRTEALIHEVLQGLQQTLGAVKEIKVLGRERYFYEAFDRTERGLVRVRHMHATLGAVPRLLVETLFVVGAFVLIALVVLLGHAGPDALPLLGLYAYAGFRIIPSANRMMLYVSEIRSSTASVEQVEADLRAADGLRGEPIDVAVAPLPFADRIVLEDVSYVHEGAMAPVLRDVDLTIRRGESIGIVGFTGAGKSTLADLLLGLLTPTTGRITIDGRDLAGHTRAWQRHVGYVPQAIVLIDDTLLRNVALGVPDGEIDGARVAAAVRIAQLEELVAALPSGLDTRVGERGVRLSGGERQRVGIARALYHGPDVLIFDEATSALDNRTEADLVRALGTLPGACTRIIVAHRLSTVRDCDRLVFLKDGRVDDIGPYDALVERNPGFRTIAAQTDEGV